MLAFSQGISWPLCQMCVVVSSGIASNSFDGGVLQQSPPRFTTIVEGNLESGHRPADISENCCCNCPPSFPSGICWRAFFRAFWACYILSAMSAEIPSQETLVPRNVLGVWWIFCVIASLLWVICAIAHQHGYDPLAKPLLDSPLTDITVYA